MSLPDFSSPPQSSDSTLFQNPNPKPPPTLLHVSFNQDADCFAAGTDKGFIIFKCEPFVVVSRREDSPGGIRAVQMMFKSRFYTLLGGGPRPRYPLNKLMFWDNGKPGCIGELSFPYEVKSVRLRRDRVVVVLMQKVLVYEYTTLKKLNQIETFINPTGICVVSYGPDLMVLACLGLQKGHVRVENCRLPKTVFIRAHDSSIACLALSNDGKMLATASTKGTLIRIFNALDASPLREVRRGTDRAEIYSMAFSPRVEWLAVSSDKGTIHVFTVKSESGISDKSTITASQPNSSTISQLSFIKGVLPKYFSSNWSLAQFRLSEDCLYIVAFGRQKNTVLILGMDGRFYRCKFDPVAGGEMSVLECRNFMNQHEAPF